MATPPLDELIELCQRALHGDISLEELESAWPEEAEAGPFAAIREDLVSGVEHTPGYIGKPGIDPQKWHQMPEYEDIRSHLDQLRALRNPSEVERRYSELEHALEGRVRSEAAAVAATGRAIVEVRDERPAGGPSRVITVSPTRSSACPFIVLAQSDDEVSFFVGPPDRPYGLTVDVWDRDRDALLDRVGEYVRAVLAGRVEVATRTGSSGGRVVFVLTTGDRMEHYYNALRRPRLRKWTLHRFEPY